MDESSFTGVSRSANPVYADYLIAEGSLVHASRGSAQTLAILTLSQYGFPPNLNYWMREMELRGPDLYSELISYKMSFISALFETAISQSRTQDQICLLLMVGLYDCGSVIIPLLNCSTNAFIYVHLLDTPPDQNIILALSEYGYIQCLTKLFRCGAQMDESVAVQVVVNCADFITNSQDLLEFESLVNLLIHFPQIYSESGVCILNLSYLDSSVFEHLMWKHPRSAVTWIDQINLNRPYLKTIVQRIYRCYPEINLDIYTQLFRLILHRDLAQIRQITDRDSERLCKLGIRSLYEIIEYANEIYPS